MKAVVVYSPGNAEELQLTAVPVPRPGPDQVLVRVHAATISQIDIGIRSGKMAADYPFQMGSDVAGDVILVGAGVTECSPGDRVLVLSGSMGQTQPGGYADYVAVPAAEVHAIPDNVSYVSSVSVGRSFGKAWTALLRDGRLGHNERVVVIGAADPIGIAAIQICRWKGSLVVAVSDGRHARRLQAIGAARVVSQLAPDLPEHVKAGLGNRSASVVINVPGANLAASLETLDRHGRLVFVSGGVPQLLDVRGLVEIEAQVVGSAAAPDPADVRHIHKLLSEATFLPVIDSIYLLSQVAEAHRRAESGDRFGAVLLVPDHLNRSREQITELVEED